LEAVDIPVIVFGVDNKDKDTETLSAVCQAFAGKNLVIGPVTDKNNKQIGAQALAFGHTVIARSPIDVNLAKQLNILLLDLGLKKENMIVDPNSQYRRPGLRHDILLFGHGAPPGGGSSPVR
jgi:acetyl-CoA decarbonylase/synthase complex subunit delta